MFYLLKEPPLIFKEALISFIKWKKLRNIFARRLFKQDLASVTCGYLQERASRFLSKIDLQVLARSFIILLNLAYSYQLQILLDLTKKSTCPFLQVPTSHTCQILLKQASCKHLQVPATCQVLPSTLARKNSWGN